MIDLLPNEEQQAILDNITEVLGNEAPVARLRNGGGCGLRGDAALLGRIAELGWIGLGLAEADGGVGYSIAEEMLLFREAGRHLLSPLLLGAVLGAHVAARAGKLDLAERLVAGESRVAVLNLLADGTVQRFDGAGTDFALAWNGAGMSLYDAAAISDISEIPCVDDFIVLERGRLAGAALAHVDAATAPLPTRAKVLVAAMLVGVAEAARDMAVAYAKLREQFGQQIGAFQAIKHYCADMAVRAEAAHFQTVVAGLTLHEAAEDAAFQASAARIVAADAALRNAERNIQVHGGIGYTFDCDANLFMKRAHVLAEFGGGARRQKADILTEHAPV